MKLNVELVARGMLHVVSHSCKFDNLQQPVPLFSRLSRFTGSTSAILVNFEADKQSPLPLPLT